MRILYRFVKLLLQTIDEILSYNSVDYSYKKSNDFIIKKKY